MNKDTITRGLRYSIATGNWGMQGTAGIRAGVSQVLFFLGAPNYLGALFQFTSMAADLVLGVQRHTVHVPAIKGVTFSGRSSDRAHIPTCCAWVAPVRLQGILQVTCCGAVRRC